MPVSVALKISANSTRRARWYTKLGACKESWPFYISLNSVNANGGLITRTRAYVLRVYPLIYAIRQKIEDGHKTGKTIYNQTSVKFILQLRKKKLIKIINQFHSFSIE